MNVCNLDSWLGYWGCCSSSYTWAFPCTPPLTCIYSAEKNAQILRCKKHFLPTQRFHHSSICKMDVGLLKGLPALTDNSPKAKYVIWCLIGHKTSIYEKDFQLVFFMGIIKRKMAFANTVWGLHVLHLYSRWRLLSLRDAMYPNQVRAWKLSIAWSWHI